ncbi:hypothetical protein IC232_16590 [Microvirga sp. BT688]|uniref:hypothetical protein n=1 Tax=Microvirga sp. TaxID=1873136 RepID=UPI001688E70E|nr:hypothetical protein [Microvirga sp.]MBD2748317.1 hypothetical protein [Microvirga sp.]
MLLVFIVVGPITGVVLLSVAAMVVKLSGYRPGGDVLAASTFGWENIVPIYLFGFLPSALIGLGVAALPRMSAWAGAICTLATGLAIGISPGGWWIASMSVPPGGNGLMNYLLVATSALATLACWYVAQGLDKASESNTL